MAELVTQTELPQTIQEVLTRLKIKPRRVKATLTLDDDNQGRQWFQVAYSFNGKLTALGKFLASVAADFEQAGGVVTSFEIPNVSSLAPENAGIDDYNPRGNWRTLSIQASIRTKAQVIEHAAFWDAAVREIVRRE